MTQNHNRLMKIRVSNKTESVYSSNRMKMYQIAPYIIHYKAFTAGVSASKKVSI